MTTSKPRTICVLGSTGSIGTQVLDVAQRLDGRVRVHSLAAGSNIELLKQQIAQFHPKIVVTGPPEAADALRGSIHAEGVQVVSGIEGMRQAATADAVDTVVVAVQGFMGFLPTVDAARAGKDIAIASKEILVSAGPVVRQAVRDGGVRMIPIDSEHSALFQCLVGEPEGSIEALILTASGGPFKHLSRQEMAGITPAMALDHPTWKMGKKITVDSATLMNKGLEILEAEALFGIGHRQVEVVIHPKSIVHSLVRFTDGSIKAQIGLPDMRLPIQYALLYPERPDTGLPRLNLLGCGPLEFLPPDEDRFPCLRLARMAAEGGGTLPAAMGGADDVAVEAFLAEKIGFLEIAEVVEEVMQTIPLSHNLESESIIEADRKGRELAASIIRRRIGTAALS